MGAGAIAQKVQVTGQDHCGFRRAQRRAMLFGSHYPFCTGLIRTRRAVLLKEKDNRVGLPLYRGPGCVYGLLQRRHDLVDARG